MFFRQDMHAITLSVDINGNGTKNLLPWDWATFEGGNLEADDGKARPGNMGMEVALGGPASRQDVTLTAPFTDIILSLHRGLENAVIFSAPATVSVTMKDRLRNPQNPTFTIAGVIKSTKIPDLDVTSGDPGMYEVVISCDESAP